MNPVYLTSIYLWIVYRFQNHSHNNGCLIQKLNELDAQECYKPQPKPTFVLHSKPQDNNDRNISADLQNNQSKRNKQTYQHSQKNKTMHMNKDISKYYYKDQKRYTNSRERSISKGMDPIISLNMNLDSLAKSRERGSAERAEQLLLRIEKLYELGYYEEKPDVISYNAVLNAWARSRERNCAQRAETLLQKMEERYANGDEDMKPNVISFNCVLNAFANSRAKGSPARAEEMLHQMEELYLAGNKDVKPNRVSYHSVMNAYASSRGKDSPEKTRKILDKMMELYGEGIKDMKPNIRTFNTLCKAYANSKDDNIEEKLDELLKTMFRLKIYPDQYTYGPITTAYAKNGKVKAAEKILSQMELLYFNGNRRMKPNKFIYSSLITAFGNARDGKGAEQTLHKMERMADNDIECKPDVVCFTGVIHAYARCKTMDSKTKAEKAEELFHRMESLYADGDASVKPTIQTCCALINAFTANGEYERAEIVLQKLKKYKLQPNRIFYNSLLKVLANSSKFDKAEQAMSLLYNMKEKSKRGRKNMSPNIITHENVILCAAYSHGGIEHKRTAMSIALNIFNQLFETSQDQMTTFTYGVFILACRNLLQSGEERVQIVKQVFDLCCEEGKLSNHIILQIQKSVPEERLVDIFGDEIKDVELLSIKDFPKEWSALK